MPGIGAQAVVDLDRQFASRSQDQGARATRSLGRGLVGGQTVQQRQAECCGLAGAGLGAGQQIATGQGQRNRFGLDRGRCGVVEFCERAQQRGRKPEGFKGHWWCS